jgi:hypothetical protein
MDNKISSEMAQSGRIIYSIIVMRVEKNYVIHILGEMFHGKFHDFVAHDAMISWLINHQGWTPEFWRRLQLPRDVSPLFEQGSGAQRRPWWLSKGKNGSILAQVGSLALSHLAFFV